MIHLTTLLTLLLTLHLHASTLRISQVVEKDSENSTEFVLKRNGKQAKLHISDKPIVVRSELIKAEVQPKTYSTILITLTEKGGEKLRSATEPLTKGKDRLAIIVDGELVSAGTLQADSLKANFCIDGFSRTLEDIEQIAAKIDGRKYSKPSPEKIAEATKARSQYRQTKINQTTPSLKKISDQLANNSGTTTPATLLESISIPDLTHPINIADVSRIAEAFVLAEIFWETLPKDQQQVRTDSDIIKILALHFPEVSRAIKGKKHIGIDVIAKLIGPYATGSKIFPRSIKTK